MDNIICTRAPVGGSGFKNVNGKPSDYIILFGTFRFVDYYNYYIIKVRHVILFYHTRTNMVGTLVRVRTWGTIVGLIFPRRFGEIPRRTYSVNKTYFGTFLVHGHFCDFFRFYAFFNRNIWARTECFGRI